MQRAVLGSDEGLRLYKAPKLKEGDIVVYYLRTSEREGVEVDQGQELFKYSPRWSTPVKVISVRDSTVEVESQSGKNLLLPERLVRKIGANAPLSLQKLVLSKVDKELARLSVKPDWESEVVRKRARTNNVDECMLHDENVIGVENSGKMPLLNLESGGV